LALASGKLLTREEARRIAANVAKHGLIQIKACGFTLQSLLARQAEWGPKLEEVMTTLKTLIVVTALLASGTSLVVAQNGPPTSDQLPKADGAAGNLAVAGAASSTSARTAHHHGTKHHRMYMMSVNRTHKGSKLTPAGNAKPQMKQ